MTTDSPAATIIADCDDVVGRHLRVEIEGFAHCNYCGLEGVWPCDAYANARDLREAVVALREARSRFSDAKMRISAQIVDNTLAAIAERGEKSDE